MIRVVRLLTLLVTLASLQLSLVSGGPGCPMPSRLGPRASAMAAMDLAAMDLAAMDVQGMDMAGTAMAGIVTGVSPNDAMPASRGPGEDAPPDAPCDESAAPDACPTMAPCMFAATPVTERPIPGRTEKPTRVIALLVAMPRSVSAAPELPPPRA